MSASSGKTGSGSYYSGSSDITKFIAALAGILFVLIAIPSALATWYSRCYKQTLTTGFLILFAPMLIGFIGMLLPPHLQAYFLWVTGIVLSVVTIYAVYLQFTGQCNLGFK